MIVGFVMFLFIPLILSSYSKASEIDNNSRYQRESYFLNELMDYAELAYSSSLGTVLKRTVYIPYSVVGISSSKFEGSTIISLKDQYGNEITQLTNASVLINGMDNLDKKGYREIIFEKKYDNANDEYYVEVRLG